MDAPALIAQVEAMVNQRFNISEDELAKIHPSAVHSTAKAEAL